MDAFDGTTWSDVPDPLPENWEDFDQTLEAVGFLPRPFLEFGDEFSLSVQIYGTQAPADRRWLVCVGSTETYRLFLVNGGMGELLQAIKWLSPLIVSKVASSLIENDSSIGQLLDLLLDREYGVLAEYANHRQAIFRQMKRAAEERAKSAT